MKWQMESERIRENNYRSFTTKFVARITNISAEKSWKHNTLRRTNWRNATSSELDVTNGIRTKPRQQLLKLYHQNKGKEWARTPIVSPSHHYRLEKREIGGKAERKGRERSNRNRRTKLWRTKGWIYRIFLLGVEESADLGFLSFVEEWAEKRECVTDAAESAALTPWTKRSEAERGGKGWRPKQQLFSSVVEGSRATAVAPGRF